MVNSIMGYGKQRNNGNNKHLTTDNDSIVNSEVHSGSDGRWKTEETEEMEEMEDGSQKTEETEGAETEDGGDGSWKMEETAITDRIPETTEVDDGRCAQSVTNILGREKLIGYFSLTHAQSLQ